VVDEMPEMPASWAIIKEELQNKRGINKNF